ncbi:MAG TPA: methyltransferase domain-containing protein [Peptococcaceae bacterium]|nr:methyltransferase domain-containing protein [Peptococcaceae bacterium]
MANERLIKESFAKQADNFESSAMSFSKEEYLAYTLKKMELCAKDIVLEVASGTCANGRAIAPNVDKVVCLDLTPEMLEVGRKKAEEQKLSNMLFVLGNAYEIPFLNNYFDVVFSRLAFHHFTDTKKAFAEMERVLKPGGKLVIIDMIATDELLRKQRDYYETLRDLSHVMNLSRQEITALYENVGMNIILQEVTDIEVSLNSWMELTKTPEDIRKQIQEAMECELNGGSQTGFYPYKKSGDIKFLQKWMITIGKKV